jgi:acyl dehydratase
MSDSEKGVLAEGRITPELIKEMEGKKGIMLKVDNYLNNVDVTTMAIRSFANGVGDGNPLWRNVDYAENSSYKRITAPPMFVYSILPAAPQFGWRGIGGFNAQNELHWYRPIFPGQHIDVTSQYKDFKIKELKNGGKRIFEYEEQRYTNDNDELVCLFTQMNIRVERATMRKNTESKVSKEKKGPELPYPWTDEELAKVEEEIMAEEFRGKEPRFWEDVQEGDELKPVVKGPIGLSDMVAFFLGGATPVRPMGHEMVVRDKLSHPAWYFRDPDTYAIEPVYAVHYNNHAAKAQTGIAWPYDVGIQRNCWQGHLLTNWMGDDGWLKTTKVEYRGFVYLSDVIRLGGRVVKKYIDSEGEPCVDIETYAQNQRGQNTMPGSAVVVLPSRDKDYWPVKNRVE